MSHDRNDPSLFYVATEVINKSFNDFMLQSRDTLSVVSILSFFLSMKGGSTEIECVLPPVSQPRPESPVLYISSFVKFKHKSSGFFALK